MRLNATAMMNAETLYFSLPGTGAKEMTTLLVA